MGRLPNLFAQGEHAERLYSIYLSLLSAKSRNRRVVDACHQIRRLAFRSGRARRADFTYSFEIDALCQLNEFATAWRRLRRLERIAFGRAIKLKAYKWTPTELEWFAQYHPQILYFMRKYKLARLLYEAMLSKMLMNKRKGLGYELLGYVYNPLARPRKRQEVTLHHLYRKLGTSLREWQHWGQFVTGFDSKIFELSGVAQADLLQDPSLLRPFYKAISEEREARLTAGISVGESEILDPSNKVRKHQETIIDKMTSQAATYTTTRHKLEEFFPELRRLH